MIRELIRSEFDARQSVVSVGRVLKKLGLSPQRPLYRAWQVDSEAAQRWPDTDFPQICAEAPNQGPKVPGRPVGPARLSRRAR